MLQHLRTQDAFLFCQGPVTGQQQLELSTTTAVIGQALAEREFTCSFSSVRAYNFQPNHKHRLLQYDMANVRVSSSATAQNAAHSLKQCYRQQTTLIQVNVHVCY